MSGPFIPQPPDGPPDEIMAAAASLVPELQQLIVTGWAKGMRDGMEQVATVVDEMMRLQTGWDATVAAVLVPVLDALRTGIRLAALNLETPKVPRDAASS